MGFAGRMTAFWQCDECGWEWVLDSESGPRQCPNCGSRKWNDSIVRDAKLYEQALAVRHLNRHRRPLFNRQRRPVSRTQPTTNGLVRLKLGGELPGVLDEVLARLQRLI